MPAGVLVTLPLPEPEAVTDTWTGLGGWVVELPPPQPDSNKMDKSAANPPQSVQNNRMESPKPQKPES